MIYLILKGVSNLVQTTKENMDMYLADTKVKTMDFLYMEILDYWKDKQHRYGDLAFLAHDVLNIRITTVAYAFAFSVGGWFQILLEIVSTLKVFKHWFVLETGYVALLSLNVKFICLARMFSPYV